MCTSIGYHSIHSILNCIDLSIIERNDRPCNLIFCIVLMTHVECEGGYDIDKSPCTADVIREVVCRVYWLQAHLVICQMIYRKRINELDKFKLI